MNDFLKNTINQIRLTLFRFFRAVGYILINKNLYSIFKMRKFLNQIDGHISSEGNKYTLKFEYTRPIIIKLRKKTSDVTVFRQIFIQREYEPIIFFAKNSLKDKIKIIVDAGANIGLTSIQFANRFEQAKVFSIEADIDNYNLLVDNLKCNKLSKVSSHHRALWSSSEKLSITNSFRDSQEWSRRVTTELQPNSEVLGLTITDLMEMTDGSIDILKIDIEGAEAEFFKNQKATIDLLNKTTFIAIELHQEVQFNQTFEAYLTQCSFTYAYVNQSLMGINLQKIKDGYQ